MLGGTKSKTAWVYKLLILIKIDFSWDEWVPESRVLKYNEANVARQKEVQKAHSAQQSKNKKVTKKTAVVKSDVVKDGDSRASTPVAEVVAKGI